MNKLIFFAAFIYLIASVSCRKDNGNSPTPILTPPNQTNLNDFFNANATVPTTFTINAGTGGMITGNLGTQITAPANAFITHQGVIVSGNVVLSLSEIYSRKDMILNRVQTMTSSNMLSTGGELYVTATQNGLNLKLYPGKQLSFQLPAGTMPSYSMQVFYGATNLTTNNLYWLPTIYTAPPVSNTLNVINPYYYSFPSDSLNWIGCSSYYNSPNLTPVTITTHGNYNATNTAVFLVFPSINCVAYLSGNDQTFNGYQFPVGINMTIVAISKINGNFYASYTPSTIVLNHLQDLNLSATKDTDILAKLATL